MDADAFPEPDVEVPTVDAATLRERLDRGEPVFVLDTRAADDFDAWHLDGEAAEVVNVPSVEFLDGVDEETLAALPEDREVVVRCAKGGASASVAGLLLEGGYDVTHLEGGVETWAELYALDDDVVIGGAHSSDHAEPAADGTYTATLGQLRAEMDALTLGRDAFVDLVPDDVPPRPANVETIIETNLGQASPGEEEASRLEPGPNGCAASQEALTGG